MTARIFAATSRRRPSGDAPSRFSTLYDRSKPVEIPRLTIAEETTASVSTEAVSWPMVVEPGSTSTLPKKTSTNRGMIMTSSSCS